MKPENKPVNRKPQFFDVTLRDGNQALRKPWDLKEKEIIFQKLVDLRVQGIEVGFASASKSDFEACSYLASIAPSDVHISSLSRAKEREIEISWEAIHRAVKPRIHIVYPVSDFAIKNILQISESEVIANVVRAVSFARNLAGTKGTVQFSGEHFGDARENTDFAIEVFKAAIAAGADVVNLPNTVERYRPMLFVRMVEKAVQSLPENTIVSVHTHNDLGMATATTVESFFAGATQLECAMNGLGERAGNTNLYEVACALYNCGVDVPINLKEIYSASQVVSRLSGIPVSEKAPIIGSDVFSHRSGIHQDGVSKTKGMQKGAYRAINAEEIGRKERESVRFTSQSGTAAILYIFSEFEIELSVDEARILQPIFKEASEKSSRGELTPEEMIQIYEKQNHLVNC